MQYRIFTSIIAMVCLLSCAAAGTSESKKHEAPPITAGVPFFYYTDLREAVDWYQNKLGLEVLVDKEWVVIFRLNEASYLGLVNATGGSLVPTENKGALLSIETQDLEGWWDRLKDIEGINMIHGIEVGAQGLVQEFRMQDPGGYVVEFYRWMPEHSPYAQ